MHLKNQKKKTVDIDILVTLGMVTEKSCHLSEVEPVEPVQMNIYQSNTCRKDLS